MFAAAAPAALLLVGFVALVGLATVMLTVGARRRGPVAAIGLLVAAVPKAGIKLGDFPIPVMLFVLAAGLGLVLWPDRSRLRVPASLWLAVGAVVAWLSARLVVLDRSGASLGVLAALAAWYLLPVSIAAFAAAGPRRPSRPRVALGRGLEWGILVAAGFALVQLLVGIEETKVPGLTIAWGDSYKGKPLVIWADNYDPFSKIPSTYQNGNVLGPVMAFALVAVVHRSVLNRRINRFDAVLGSFAALACLLSGSRTVILGLLAAGVLVAARARFRQVVAAVALAAGLLVTAFTLQPGLAERFSLDYLLSPKGAGRTDQWLLALGDGVPYRLLVGTEDWSAGDVGATEGLIGALQRVGLFGVALLGVTLWLVLRRSQFAEWRLPCVVLVVAFAIDSSYLVFPTMFIPFARMWAPLRLDGPRSRRRRSAVGPGGERSVGEPLVVAPEPVPRPSLV